MMRAPIIARRRTLILALASGCATSPPTPEAADAGSAKPPRVAEREAEPEVTCDGDCFWVLHDDGIHAHDLEGTRASATLVDRGERALHLPDGRLLVLSEDGSATTLTVLTNGRVDAELSLPNRVVWASCEPEFGAEHDAVMTQAPIDFSVDHGRTHACIHLALAPGTHAEREVTIAIDLASYAVDARVVTHDDLDCELEPHPVCAHPSPTVAWVSGSSPASPAPAADWSTTIGERVVLSRDGELYLPLCRDDLDPATFEAAFDCASIEATSTSGRWLLVGGLIYETETLVRRVYLFDRETEILATFDCVDGHCVLAPAPTSAVFDEDPDHPALEVELESDVASLPEDRLWIDGQLVLLERGELVRVGGRLVRAVSSEAP